MDSQHTDFLQKSYGCAAHQSRTHTQECPMFILWSGSVLAAPHTPSLSTPVRSSAIQGHETKQTQVVFRAAKTSSPASSPPSCSPTGQLYACRVRQVGTECRRSCEAGRMRQAQPPRSAGHRGFPRLAVLASISSAPTEQTTKAGLGARTATATRVSA